MSTAWATQLSTACSSPGRTFPEPQGGSNPGGSSQAGGGSAGTANTGGAGTSSTGGASAGNSGDAGSGDGGSLDGGAGDSGGVGCDGVTCATEADCSPTPAPHCVCPNGYADPRGDGTLCEDIDECATDNGGCDPKVTCKNAPGSFSCDVCPDGYEQNPQGACVDINECLVDNGGCDPLVACSNTDGGRACGDCPSLSCGGSCCPTAPANSVAQCQGNSCAVACKTNYHSCSADPATCYPNSDTKHCGASCAVCSQPNATATCTAGACSYSCGSGLSLGCLYPDGRPVCSRWDFESNTVEGFAIDVAGTTASDGRFLVSTKHATSGSRSLAIGFVSANSSGIVDVKIPLCPGGQGLNLQDRKLTMDFYAETATGTTPYPVNRNGNYVTVKGKSGETFGGCDSDTPDADQAFAWECSTAGWPQDTSEITLRFRVFEKWSGTMYIDNIKLQ
ncbi:MAG: hypothetical protein K0R38_2777 [Polyangiaceae bacterium]|nr:hypothetical protein [Polyangiaceae bacterium]